MIDQSYIGHTASMSMAVVAADHPFVAVHNRGGVEVTAASALELPPVVTLPESVADPICPEIVHARNVLTRAGELIHEVVVYLIRHHEIFHLVSIGS